MLYEKGTNSPRNMSFHNEKIEIRNLLKNTKYIIFLKVRNNNKLFNFTQSEKLYFNTSNYIKFEGKDRCYFEICYRPDLKH